MGFFFKQYALPTVAAIFAFALAGAVCIPLKRAALEGARVGIDAGAVRASLGKGVLFGILGGYRSLVSDFVWIKSYVDWEKKDVAACAASIELAAAIDPYMTIFWTQGASIIAFDTPYWLLEKMPRAQQGGGTLNALKAKQAKAAMTFLDKGLGMFPSSRALLIEKGQIAIGAEDFVTAEACYGKVAAMPDAAVYVRRIYASILARNGKFDKALAVLESILPDIDKDSPAHALILDQIKKAKELAEKSKLK